MRHMNTLSVLVAASIAAGAGAGNILVSEDFETGTGGWQFQGNELLFPGGNPGNYLGIPLIDSFGITFGTSDASSPLIGDLTGYAGLEISFDMRTFQFRNFAGEPIDPASRPLVLQFIDRGDPDDFLDDVSVYIVGQHIPYEKDGWSRITFSVPTTTGDLLPDGWGGTGDEDPDTFEPILPSNRTFESVMANVDEVMISTFVPGFFYGFTFWEIGVDNLLVREIPAPGAAALLGVASVGLLRRRRA